MPTAQTANQPTRTDTNNSRGGDSELVTEQGKCIKELEATITGLETKLAEFERQNHILRVQMKMVLDKNTEVEKDNVSLRSQILSTQRPPGQDNEDGYYIQKLSSLNETTQQWVASAFKGRCSRALDATAEDNLQNILRYYKVGGAFLRSMNENKCTIQTLFQNPITRIGLVRQLIAIFLSSEIFNRFCIGIPEELDNALLRAMENVVVEGMAMWSGQALIKQNKISPEYWLCVRLSEKVFLSYVNRTRKRRKKD
jgi:hypothetical protein